MSDIDNCPKCGREFLAEYTGGVSFGDMPEDAVDYCNTATWSDDGFAVYWHSDEQLQEKA